MPLIAFTVILHDNGERYKGAEEFTEGHSVIENIYDEGFFGTNNIEISKPRYAQGIFWQGRSCCRTRICGIRRCGDDVKGNSRVGDIRSEVTAKIRYGFNRIIFSMRAKSNNENLLIGRLLHIQKIAVAARGLLKIPNYPPGIWR
jgi:hypothetical protein